MSAALIAVVLALLLGHFLPGLVALRRYDWFVAWLQWLARHSGSDWPGRIGIALAVGLPVLGLALLQWSLRGELLGLPAFLLALAMLLYTWGPGDLHQDVEAVIEAREPEARRAAAQQLYPEGGEPSTEGPALVEAVFRCALWRWFGVLFWFVLLGPAGALLYRLLALCAQGEARQRLADAQRGAAATALALLNWPVAQLMTFALALAADFDRVLAAWREAHAEGMTLDVAYLGAAARVSVDCELADEEVYAIDGSTLGPDLLELRDAMSLVWRVLLLWLGVLALFVLAGWAS